MAIEIERKFLLCSDEWRSQVSKKSVMRQGYLSTNKEASVRIRLVENIAQINVKSATLGMLRSEYEYEIPAHDAQEMLDNLCEKPLIEKTRHYVIFAGHEWEIDVFTGDNAGLVVAEVELNDIDEKINKPAWLGQEVTEEKRYYNVCLVRNPYKDWG